MLSRQDNGPGSLSSTIGIICAIVGNILISIALNIQRYSHLRIEKESQQCNRKEVRQRRKEESTIPTVQVNGVICSAAFDHPKFDGTLPVGKDAGELQAAHRTLSYGNTHVESATPYPQLQYARFSEETELLPKAVVPVSDKESGTVERQSYLSSPYWWGGIILMFVGEVGNFIAYGFAPASVVSPLGVVSLMANCLIAPFLLNEKFRQRDFWGVLVAISGTVAVVLSTNESQSRRLGPGEIWAAVTSLAFEIYLDITLCLIVLLTCLTEGRYSESIFVDIGLVGLYGGYTALSTKGISSILSVSGWHIVTYPITYPLLFVLLFTAMLQVRYINRALQKFGSTQVIPTQFVLFTISVIVGSAVLYGDFASATLRQTAVFIGGCSLTFFGVYLLTTGRSREAQVKQMDEEEAADTVPSTHEQEQQWRLPGPVQQETVHVRAHDPQSVVSISHETPEGVEDYQRLRSPQHPISTPSLTPRSPILNILASQASSVDRHFNMPYSVVEEPSSFPSLSVGDTASSSQPTDQELHLQSPAAPGSHGKTASPSHERPQIRRPRTPRLTMNRRSVDNFGSFAPLGPLSTSLTALAADPLEQENMNPNRAPSSHARSRRKTYQRQYAHSPSRWGQHRHSILDRPLTANGRLADPCNAATPPSTLSSTRMPDQTEPDREKFFDGMRKFSNSLTRNIGKVTGTTPSS